MARQTLKIKEKCYASTLPGIGQFEETRVKHQKCLERWL
jgi:hypothetical protein